MIKLLLLNKYLRIVKQSIVLLFFFKNISFGQNLVQNGSFENIAYPADWNNWSGQFINYSETPTKRILFSWDEFNSADLFTASCTHTWSSVPINIKGYSQAKDGNNYVGFMLFGNGLTNDGKEYIYQQLTTPLVAGKIYCLSFYVSRADRKEYAIKNIGAYFSNTLQSTGSMGYINKTPQVVHASGVITDTINWTQIQGCFTATGGEQFITIGNFNSDANTDTLHPGTNNPIPSNPEYAYYYIDDITLIEDLNTGITEKDYGYNITVSPNPANTLLSIRLNTARESMSIIIINTLGETVIQQPLNEQKAVLNIEYLQSGIYYYEISVNGKSIKNDKIVVIK